MSEIAAASPFLASRCSLPPWALASHEFQDNPWPIEITGIRQAEGRLFRDLDKMDDPEERGQFFHDYLSERFQIEAWLAHRPDDEPASRHNYLRYLLGWGVDSSSPSGAVLKHWVESRFGLKPTFHRGRLAVDPQAREHYHNDRMRGEAETMGITMQLDLLYTFCQYELERRLPGQRWLTLFRGTHDPDAYAAPSRDDSQGTIVELNNLSSFSSDKEVAWEFGTLVWEVKIPLVKIVFFSGLLPNSLLRGESEYLVLGGQYRVRKLRF